MHRFIDEGMVDGYMTGESYYDLNIKLAKKVHDAEFGGHFI